MWRCEALQELFHAGQAGVEGGLDEPSPDLFATVLVIRQVEGGVGEQVGCSGLARVRDRPQTRGVEDIGNWPFGHDVDDPGLRDGEDVGPGKAGQCGGDFVAGEGGEQRVDEPAELLGRHPPVRGQEVRDVGCLLAAGGGDGGAAPHHHVGLDPHVRRGVAVPSGYFEPYRCLGWPGRVLRPAIWRAGSGEPDKAGPVQALAVEGIHPAGQRAADSEAHEHRVQG